MASLGTKLTDSPTDGITRVQFAPSSSSKLLVTGWDKTLRVYDVDANTLLASHEAAAPLLDAAWAADGSAVYSGAVDGAVRRCVLPTRPVRLCTAPQARRRVWCGDAAGSAQQGGQDHRHAP